MTELEKKIACDATDVERELEALYGEKSGPIGTLFEAEKYSLLAGGKRIRPFIVLQVCDALGGDRRAALPFAAALEMIHTYSLIHDDLPCMDDDDMRRGRPTNHKVYGYSTALLAGDALLTRAFLTASGNPYVTAETARDAVGIMAEAAGDEGMIGGQVIDLDGETRRLDFDELLTLHRLKTGALIRCAALLGVLAAGYGIDSKEANDAVAYAEGIGLAFQVVDDILDATATEEALGKSVGGDAERNKTTFLSYYSVDGARAYAREITENAVRGVSHWESPKILCELAYYLLDRKK